MCQEADTRKVDPMTHHLEQLPAITARLRTAHPNHTQDLNRIDDDTAELARWLPEARNVNTRSALQSPNLEPHRGAGGHGDRTADLAVNGYTDTGTTRRGNTGRLDEADGRIRDAHLALAYAPPDDPGPAIHVAQGQLAKAVSLVHATIPKTYDPKRDRLNNPPACANCLQHGHHTDAAPDGGRHCRWCADVKRAYNTLPDLELLEHHTNGRVPTRAFQEFEARTRGRRTKQRAKAKAGRR